MTMITPSYLGETIEYSSLHACRSTLEDPTDHIAECIKMAREGGHREIDVSPETEEWWVQEVIEHRGKTSRNSECTPGYYNFEGEFNRRQDGNYNGGFQQYFEHMKAIRAELPKHFLFG